MEKEAIQKVYPTCEELSSVCSKIKCSQENCKAVFQSSSNLNMHLIKHHQVENNGLTTKRVETQYFCPVFTCSYYKDSKKHFAKLKYLKQHYLKVHAFKEFSCKKCSKKFSTETFRTLHMKNCGKLFMCTCGSYYKSSEAILTHCKRKGKGHSIVEKSDKDIKISDVLHGSEPNNIKRTERFIYPKLSSDRSFPIHYIAAIALSELSTPCNISKVVDKGIQTDASDFWSGKDSKSCITVRGEKKRKNSQQTQTATGKSKKLKISAQTQTNSEYLKHKSKMQPKTFLRKRKKSMETQTKDQTKIDSSLGKSNLLTNASRKSKFLDDVLSKNEGVKFWDNQFFAQKEIVPPSNGRTNEVKNELLNIGVELNLCSKEIDLNEYGNVLSKNNTGQYASEQGSESQMFDLNKLCNIETQTEIDAFLTECNDDTTFTLCSTTETQTTDDFDSLLYSNMCTQTCEEVDQLFNFNFVHIETQTAWPDLNDCGNLDS